MHRQQFMMKAPPKAAAPKSFLPPVATSQQPTRSWKQQQQQQQAVKSPVKPSPVLTSEPKERRNAATDNDENDDDNSIHSYDSRANRKDTHDEEYDEESYSDNHENNSVDNEDESYDRSYGNSNSFSVRSSQQHGNESGGFASEDVSANEDDGDGESYDEGYENSNSFSVGSPHQYNNASGAFASEDDFDNGDEYDGEEGEASRHIETDLEYDLQTPIHQQQHDLDTGNVTDDSFFSRGDQQIKSDSQSCFDTDSGNEFERSYDDGQQYDENDYENEDDDRSQSLEHDDESENYTPKDSEEDEYEGNDRSYRNSDNDDDSRSYQSNNDDSPSYQSNSIDPDEANGSNADLSNPTIDHQDRGVNDQFHYNDEYDQSPRNDKDDNSDSHHEDDYDNSHSRSENSDDRSYNSTEDRDRSYVNESQSIHHSVDDNQSYSDGESANDDNESYGSQEEDENQAYNSAEDRSNHSGDQSHVSDDRSYASGVDNPEDERSLASEEEDQSHVRGENDEPNSFSSGADDRSYVSDEQHNRSGMDGDDDQSHESGDYDQDDARSYVEGDQQNDDRSFVSGEEEDNRSYYSSEDDQSYESGNDDKASNDNDSYGDRSCSSNENIEERRSDSNRSEQYADDTTDSSHRNKYPNVNIDSDNNERLLNIKRDDPVLNKDSERNISSFSNESMPIIELEEESDTENDGSYRENSPRKQDRFYHEEPSFSSKINSRMDTSESTSGVKSRRDESVNKSSNTRTPSGNKNDFQSSQYQNEDDGDTYNSASLNDFDSFAYEASVTSLLVGSSHKKSQIGVGVDIINATEEASVISALETSPQSKRNKMKEIKNPEVKEAPLSSRGSVALERDKDQGSVNDSHKSDRGERFNIGVKGIKGNAAKTRKHDSTSAESDMGSFSGSNGRDAETKSSHGDSGSIACDETLMSDDINDLDDPGNGTDKTSRLKSAQDEDSLSKDDLQSIQDIRLPAPKVYNGYNRDQIVRWLHKEQAAAEPSSVKKRRSRARRNPLLELAENVNNGVIEGEQEMITDDQPVEIKAMRISSRLLYAFEALTGIFLQLSDELELLKTFANGKITPTIDTLESLLGLSGPLNDLFKKLEPILVHHVTAEIDEELEDFLYGMNLIVDLLCDLSHRVGEKQIWNARANSAFATLLELLARDTLEVCCIFDDVDTPEYEVTDLIQDAWEATGHIEEIKALVVTDDLFMFRQICYEVILSTDQWCPDVNVLMEICGIEVMSQGNIDHDEDEIMASPPEAALQVLEKIHGEPLPRTATLGSVIRRLLPSNAIFDVTISDNIARLHNTIRNQDGIPPSSLVTITSIPESFDDPDALGVAGVGKTTLAAMVACHDDILRFFNDGIAWIYVGEIELNYNRYVQCLQDLLSQLEVDEDEEPLFPELLHIPGESQATRKRREEGFMIYLRETIVEFLRYRNVLIILDDVCFEPDLDWFDFAPAPPMDDEEVEEEGSYAILVTSRRRNLLPPADTVEVDMLDNIEGIELLIGESGDIAKAINAESDVTKSLIRECAGHPLTIKSVSRWLNLKHTTTEADGDDEKLRNDVTKSMEKIFKNDLLDGTDMMYEILNMSLCPTINGEQTTIIKFCFAAFVRVFCQRKHISDFALADSTPIVPMASTELLFESLLDLEEETLLKEGSLFYSQKKEAAKLIPDVLASLGVFKVIITYTEAPEDSSEDEEEDEKYLQIVHRIQQEYGEHLFDEDPTLTDLTKDAERRWNRAFAKAFIARDVEWDSQTPDAGLDYALEMLPSHMMRGGLLMDAVKLLRNEKFIRGRLSALGRENGSRRHIKDSELLFDLLAEKRALGNKKMDPKGSIRLAYDTLGRLLKMGEDQFIEEEGSPEAVEVGRCHFEIGFSLAERRCWEGAITHWELSQEFLVVSIGMVELVAGLLFNIAVVNTEMHDYDSALGSLKQCLRIRGAIHGEEHILYAQTIQKIGDVFLSMSDYHEAMEAYDWALDVMHVEPSHHRINIGDILEQIGSIHYIKGEIEDSLQSYQDALRSKQIDLGEDHPELAQIFHHIGNCLSNLGKTDEAIAHLEEAIRLKQLDITGGYERDSDILTINGILNNLNCRQKEGLECYEKALQILVTKVPHKKEKVAALLHLVGCVYLMSGEHKKALKLFEESLYARRKVLGFVHLEVASTLFNMAFLHQSRNRLDKSLKCLEESLRIRQLRLPDSEKVAVTHEKIGNLARGIGKTKKAENAFNEALRIRKIIHGNNHEAVATVLQELGDLMDDLGEYEDAMKHYVEALEIRENRLGPDDLAVAETYYSMGFTLQNNGALDRALQCLEESLSIRKFQLGDDSKDVGDTLNIMGFLQAKRGELDDALTLLWDALRIRKLQDDNIKVSETLNNIGNVHREKQEFDLAIECYEECLRIRRAELGDGHEKVADALIGLGNVQCDMEYNHEAMDSFKEALAIRNMIFGEQDESVAAVLQCMGTLEFRANELDRAFQLLDEFIRIRDENGTEPDGDYVNVLFMIGNIHKMQGYEDDAKKCWTQAYGIFKKLGLAETNPQIAEIMSNLVKDDVVDTTTASENVAGTDKAVKGVLGRISAKVKRVARTANEAGKAVKKVTGIKSKDRGSQLL